MFTLINPIAAILYAVFAYFTAQAFRPLFDPYGSFAALPLWAALAGAFIGMVFVGRQIGRAAWFSVYAGLQGVVLTPVVLALAAAVPRVFDLGYRRRYDGLAEALAGYFGIVVDWLRLLFERDLLFVLALGGAGLGLVLHVIYLLLERRRNAR